MSYIGNAPISAAFLVDIFSGTGSQTAFTMTVAPANTSSIIVAVTGVLQSPDTYSVSGTTLTFSAAPPSGTNNISVRYLGIPASGVTTTAYRTVTNTTATAGQTSFTIPSYTVGYVDVYRNGVYLPTSDYTATTGTTVVLNNAATAGDTITTVSFYVSSVLNAIPNSPASVGSSNIVSGVSLTSPTLASPTFTGTATGTVLVSGTAQATTSGTSIDFTSIPSWVKRITVMFSGVSTNGTGDVMIQLGTGGAPTTSGYLGTGTNNATTFNFSNGFKDGNQSASCIRHGSYIFSNLTGNTWTCSAVLGRSDAATTNALGGSIALSGTLNLVRITTTNGTDTFDAGSINILYE